MSIVKLDNVPNLIYTCFVLHHFCERKKTVNFGETDRIVVQDRRQQPPADKVFSYFTSEVGKFVILFQNIVKSNRKIKLKLFKQKRTH